MGFGGTERGPRTGGSRTVGRLCRPDLCWCLPLVRFLCPSAMSAYLLLSPSTFTRYWVINIIESHQNGSTCPSPGDKDAHDKSYEPEKEAKLMNVEADNQNKMEKADLVGMESEENDVEENVIAYDAGLMSAVSSSSSSATGSAEERHYGDDGNFKSMAGEERRSITDKIDKYSKFDRRSAQTIAVVEAAIQNEPTPSVLNKLFWLDGQTGHLQSDRAE